MSVPPPLPQAPRNPILTFFAGLWNVVNFTRRLILNLLVFGLLFLFLVVLLVVAGSSGKKVGPLHDRTTLVLAPQGALVEQFTTDPATRALAKALGDNGGGEVQLRDLLRVLKAAKDDAKIERVLLDVDALQPSGFASLREVAAALGELRASGKQVVAFSEGMGQGQYLLAAQASEVYLDPLGGITLTGLSSSRPYFREALQEKLGIDMHLFRVGEYKSAAEPYIRDAASAEAREADLYWMGDLWQRYLQDVAAARKLDVGQLAAAIDDLPGQVTAVGGDLAKLAVAHKLVDGLKTREDVEALLAERGVADADSSHGFRSIELQDYLLQLDARQRVLDKRPKVAIVVASGAITSGEQPAGSIGGVSTSELLRSAREDDDVKAVVLRVDSPGGEVFPSEQIRREVLALKQAGKPVVVSMGDVAASGGYWISASADRIYADASTISGSIGIYGLIPNVARALDKIGVHTDGVSTTRWAGAFDVTRPLDPQVGQVWQAVLDKGYADFLATVSEGRGKSAGDVDAVARGRVWSGAQAQERGLVDELGGLQAAVADAAARAGLGDADAYQVRYIERSGSPFEQFLGSLAGSRLGVTWLNESDFARLLLRQALPGADAQLKAIERSIKDGPKPMAHCFCGL